MENNASKLTDDPFKVSSSPGCTAEKKMGGEGGEKVHSSLVAIVDNYSHDSFRNCTFSSTFLSLNDLLGKWAIKGSKCRGH